MLISRRKKWALIFLYGSVQAVIIWNKTATKTFEIFLIKSKKSARKFILGSYKCGII